MTEVLFYHLDNVRLEAVLPPLLEKSLARGWRVAVQVASDDRIDSLDAHLWTYREDSFLPHGTDRDNSAAAQPVTQQRNNYGVPVSAARLSSSAPCRRRR